MITQSPTSNLSTASLNNRIDNLTANNIDTRNRPCEVQFYCNNADQIRVVSRYPSAPIWINGVVYYISERYSDAYGIKRDWQLDLNAVGIDTENGVGGIVDFSDITRENDYLIWAVANDTNTEFLGFGMTKRPISEVSSFVGGNHGGVITCTLPGTLLENAFRFNIGGRVIVRNSAGTMPIWQFNQGVIIDIPDKYTIKVQLDNCISDNSSAITSTSGLEIEQISGFRLTDGSINDYDSCAIANSRLVGECWYDNTIISTRHISEKWFSMRNEVRIRIDMPVSIDLAWARWLPKWATKVHIRVNLIPKATWTEIEWLIRNTTSVNIEDSRYRNDSSESVSLEYILQIESTDFSHSFELAAILAANTVRLDTVVLLGYEAELR